MRLVRKATTERESERTHSHAAARMLGVGEARSRTM